MGLSSCRSQTQKTVTEEEKEIGLTVWDGNCLLSGELKLRLASPGLSPSALLSCPELAMEIPFTALTLMGSTAPQGHMATTEGLWGRVGDRCNAARNCVERMRGLRAKALQFFSRLVRD